MEENISLRKEIKDLHHRFSSLPSASSTVVSTHASSSSSSAPSSSSSRLLPRPSSSLPVEPFSLDDILDQELFEVNEEIEEEKAPASPLPGPVGSAKKQKNRKGRNRNRK
jgi:hypothetical protein